MKILFQGDSITECNRDKTNPDDLGNGYVRVASELLAEAYPEIEFTFVNRGVSGNRVVDLYARIKKDFINLKPDYASIYIGVNDAWHEYTNQNGVDAEKFERVYGMMIQELLAARPNLKIMILEPFVLPGAATINTEEFPDRWDFFAGETVMRSAAAKRVAEKYGLTFVPLQEMFDKANADAPEMGYWLADGVHPTAAGHELIKNAWLKAFEQIK